MPAPTIVCGVDGSDNASAAVSFARILSGWLDWRLVVVHVVDPPVIPGVSLVPGGYDELLESSKEQGVELMDAILESNDVTAEITKRVDVGNRAEKLAAVCEEEDADLLVVGAPSRGRIATTLLGSVATSLVGRAPCPVAIVPQGASVSARALRRAERRTIPRGAVFRAS